MSVVVDSKGVRCALVDFLLEDEEQDIEPSHICCWEIHVASLLSWDAKR